MYRRQPSARLQCALVANAGTLDSAVFSPLTSIKSRAGSVAAQPTAGTEHSAAHQQELPGTALLNQDEPALYFLLNVPATASLTLRCCPPLWLRACTWMCSPAMPPCFPCMLLAR